MKRLLYIFISVCMAMQTTAAETDPASPRPLRPVYKAFSLSVGSAHLADTYLSPLRYTGQTVSLDYERHQAMRFDPGRWTMRLRGRLEGMHTKSPARNATMWEGVLYLDWAMMHRWRLPYGISASAGGETGITGGVVYAERNSNNPCSAKAAWHVGLTGLATWGHTFGRLPVTFAWQPSLPVAGVFFAPEYGQLYYEIYLGERSGLAHFAWWGNYLRTSQLVTADLHLAQATSLRLGFRYDLLSTRVHDITTRIYSLCFTLGVSGEWLSYSPSRRLSDATARVISAF